MNEREWSEHPDPPDLKADDKASGLMCFLDDTRECGADCMAYLPEPADPTVTSLGPQQKNCILIVSVERLGRYSAGVVSILRKGQERTEKDAADEKRTNFGPVLSPLGRRP